MIDASLLNQLFDSEDMIRRYLVLFLKDSARNMKELKESIDRQDFEDAGMLAHSIKSQLKYLMEEESANIAFTIEKICDEKELMDVKALHIHFERLNSNIKLIWHKTNKHLEM
jgi:HPt (histidine-containing phosphotransfer) domain-containing protein